MPGSFDVPGTKSGYPTTPPNRLSGGPRLRSPGCAEQPIQGLHETGLVVIGFHPAGIHPGVYSEEFKRFRRSGRPAGQAGRPGTNRSSRASSGYDRSDPDRKDRRAATGCTTGWSRFRSADYRLHRFLGSTRSRPLPPGPRPRGAWTLLRERGLLHPIGATQASIGRRPARNRETELSFKRLVSHSRPTGRNATRSPAGRRESLP